MSDRDEQSSGFDTVAFGSEAFGLSLTVDREEQARRLAKDLLAADSKLRVLYGRAGIGKTELVETWLVPLLAEEREVFSGSCRPNMPEVVVDRSGEETDLDEAIERPCFVLIDSFEAFLELPEARQEKAVQRIFERLREEAFQAVLVLVLDDDLLSRALVLRKYAPELIDSVFEIEAIRVREGLESLQAEEDEDRRFSYDSELIERIERDVGVHGGGIDPELLKVLHYQFRRYRRKTGKTVLGLADFGEMGGLWKLLRDYLDQRLKRLQKDSPDYPEIAWALISEVALARSTSCPVDLEEVQRRLALDDVEVAEVRERLSGRAGLLRSYAEDRLELSPFLLGHVVREAVAAEERLLAEHRQLIHESLEGWERLGTVMPRERFQTVDERRRDLRLEEQEEEFLLRCALLQDASEDASSARYWFRRVADEDQAAEIALEHLYSPFADVRQRAARVLGDFQEPTVRGQLHLVALQDQDAAVRAAAVQSLAAMPTPKLSQSLLAEACTRTSPHRQAAVAALRIWPRPETVALLHELVADRDSDLALRREAIGTLAGLAIPEAVDALVKIALDDEDEEDRQAAARALASYESEALNRRLLDGLRERRRPAPRARPPRRLGSVLATGAFVLIGFAVLILNYIVHGVVLLTLGRIRWGLALLGLAAVALALSVSFEDQPIGLSLFFVSALLGYLLPSGILLGDLRAQRLKPYSYAAVLGTMLALVISWASFWLAHGVAHALVRKWRTAIILFLAGWLGLCILNLFGAPPLGFEIFRPSPTIAGLPDGVREWTALFYVPAGWLLFLGSFVYDLGKVLWGSALMPLQVRHRRRREAVYELIMVNPAVSSQVFEALGDPGRLGWAKAVLRKFGRHMKPAALMRRLLEEEDPVILPWVIHGLKQARVDKTTNKLYAVALRSSDPEIIRRVVRVLAGNPDRRSLHALTRLATPKPATDGRAEQERPPGSKLDWRGRLLREKAVWQYRIAAMSLPLVVALVLAIPLASLFAYDARKVRRHPEEALVSALGRSDLTLTGQVLLSLRRGGESGPQQRAESLRKDQEIVRFLAETFPQESGEGLLRAFRTEIAAKPRLFQWWPEEDRRQLTEAVTGYRIALLRGLAEIGGPNGKPELRAAITETLVEAVPEASPAVQAEIALALWRLEPDSRDAYERAAGPVERIDSAEVWQQALLRPDAEGARSTAATMATLVKRKNDSAGLPLVAEGLAGALLLEERPEVQKALLAALDSCRRRLGAAELEGAVGRLVEGLGRTEQWVVRSAVEGLLALGRLNEEVLSVPTRRRMSEVGQFEVRRALAAMEGEEISPDVVLKELRAHLNQGEFELVIQEGTGEIQRAGEDLVAGIRSLVGRAYLGRYRLEKAIDALEAEQQSFGLDDEARSALASSYALRAEQLLEAAIPQPPQAVELAHRSLELAPTAGAAYRLLLRGYEMVEGPEEAETVLEALARDHPENPLPRFYLAYLLQEYVAPREPASSEQAYERAYRILAELEAEEGFWAAPAPLDRFQVECSLVEASLTSGRWPEAVERGARALDGAGGDDADPGLDLLLAVAQVFAGEPAAAVAHLERLRERYPKGFEVGWRWDGLRAYIRRSDLAEKQRNALVRLLQVAEHGSGGPARDVGGLPAALSRTIAVLRPGSLEEEA